MSRDYHDIHHRIRLASVKGEWDAVNNIHNELRGAAAGDVEGEPPAEVGNGTSENEPTDADDGIVGVNPPWNED